MAGKVLSSPSCLGREGTAVNATKLNVGKHAIIASMKHLQHEAQLLEEELQELDKMESSSAVCKELLKGVECRSDPLLPLVVGVTNRSWERWILRPQDMEGCGCCIL